MQLLLVEGLACVFGQHPSYDARALEQSLPRLLHFAAHFAPLHRPEDLALLEPVVRPAFHTKGPLVIQALVVALEDAAVPETEVRFHSRPHLFLLLLPVLGLQMGLELLKQFSRHNKQALLIVHILRFFQLRGVF